MSQITSSKISIMTERMQVVLALVLATGGSTKGRSVVVSYSLKGQ